MQSLGRILAAPLIADRDQPPFPRVTRDGFAVRVEDLATGAPLRIVGQLRAGEPWPPERPPLASGEAIEIMTGAALPPGADAVLMVEHAQQLAGTEASEGTQDTPQQRSILPHAGRVLIAGENVVPQGSEARQGDTLLEPGTHLGPEQIALAAACGLCSLPVGIPPKVAILATGDELVEPATQKEISVAPENRSNVPIQPHQIYNSNGYALAALIQQAGGVPLRQRPALDRLDDLAACIRQGLKAAPLLLLTGGVSMGKFDFVKEALSQMDAEFFFAGVRMQPGKPVVFGRVPRGKNLPSRYFFGLPGNPISAMVTFRVFVQPLLAALSGERHWQPNTVLAKLTTAVHSKPGLTRFLPAYLDSSQLTPTATPIQTQGSGDLAANALANCYIVVPDNGTTLPADQIVPVLLR